MKIEIEAIPQPPLQPSPQPQVQHKLPQPQQISQQPMQRGLKFGPTNATPLFQAHQRDTLQLGWLDLENLVSNKVLET